ncbi:MAG: gluconeogenesis factor YvcK family protein [Candidatus Paceibacterota bacterium]|jgi:uncharacterized cofD-like protein
MENRKKIVTIGGGTGSFVVLSGLKKYENIDLTAIVSMADDGGSTGVLRDEYGVLPPGDVRQCLVALSEADKAMRDLFNFRFSGGSLRGHNFGNIFISAMEKMTGDFAGALSTIKDVLKVRGNVVPVTLEKIKLVAELKTGQKILGQFAVEQCQLISQFGIKSLGLDKKAKANPDAIKAIKSADMVIFGPGAFYTSLMPNLLVDGIAKAIKESRAKKVYICNLMNKYGQTDGKTVFELADEVEKYIGGKVFHKILFNNKKPSASLIKKYADEGQPVLKGEGSLVGTRLLEADLLSENIIARKKGDPIKRTLIRHDPDKLAKVLVSLL